jgi:hypothetical protein
MDLPLDPSLVQNLLLCDDKSIDPEDVRTEKKIELITLHRAMKKLDMDLDYSAVVDPLLADQGPALAHIPRLIKMIQRLGKIKEECLLEREQQRAAQLAAQAESAVAAQIRLTHSIGSSPNNPASCPELRRCTTAITQSTSNEVVYCPPPESRTRRPSRADKNCSVVPPEVLPRWGELRRYTTALTQSTYNEVVCAAKWVFQRMLAHKGGPKKCSLSSLETPTDLKPPSPETPKKVRSYVTNKYLEWDNMKSAALEGKFDSVRVGYYRNTELAAARIQASPARQKFIEWAVGTREGARKSVCRRRANGSNKETTSGG